MLGHNAHMISFLKSPRHGAALTSLLIFSAALAGILGMGFGDHQPPLWLWLALIGGFGATVSTV